MQTTGDLVAATAELTTGVQDREDGLQSRLPGFLLGINWDPPPVIADRDTVIGFDLNVDLGTKSCSGLIDPVVDNFPNKVV